MPIHDDSFYATLREIIEENTPLFGKEFLFSHDDSGVPYEFEGITILPEDIYFVMFHKNFKINVYYSCICSLEKHGFKLKEEK